MRFGVVLWLTLYGVFEIPLLANDSEEEVVHLPPLSPPHDFDRPRENFLLQWNRLENRAVHAKLLATNDVLGQFNEDVLAQAIFLYHKRWFEKEEDASKMEPSELYVFSDHFCIRVFPREKRVFVDTRQAFASGKDKNLYHSVMIVFSDDANIVKALLVAKADFKGVESKDEQREVFLRTFKFAKVQLEKHHLAPAPFLSHPESSCVYFELFQGDLGSLIELMRRELRRDCNAEEWFSTRVGLFNVALDVAKQLSKALKFLHEQKIVHRDVKPLNVLYRGDLAHRAQLQFYLTDLDDALMMREAARDPQFLGTQKYCPPEKQEDDIHVPLTYESDCFALGLTVWEVLHPLLECTPMENFYQACLDIFNQNAHRFYKGKTKKFGAEQYYIDCIKLSTNLLYDEQPPANSLDSVIYGLTLTQKSDRLTSHEAARLLDQKGHLYINHFLKEAFKPCAQFDGRFAARARNESQESSGMGRLLRHTSSGTFLKGRGATLKKKSSIPEALPLHDFSQ